MITNWNLRGFHFLWRVGDERIFSYSLKFFKIIFIPPKNFFSSFLKNTRSSLALPIFFHFNLSHSFLFNCDPTSAFTGVYLGKSLVCLINILKKKLNTSFQVTYLPRTYIFSSTSTLWPLLIFSHSLLFQYEEFYSKEIEDCWAALCERWESNVSRIIDYLIVMAGLCGTPVLMHVSGGWANYFLCYLPLMVLFCLCLFFTLLFLFFNFCIVIRLLPRWIRLLPRWSACI